MPGASYWGLGNVFALAKKRTRGDRDATSHAAPYVYDPLPSRHIRLVKYTATKPKAPLALSLSIVTHAINDSCPPYIALSYTWDAPVAGDEDGDGSVTDAKYVLIDGTTSVPSMITIRQNLYDALQALGPAMLRMSRKEGVSHVWIDAICINQADATERLLQVGSMDKIYSSAASVWAWLGAADDTTSSVAWLHTKMA
ncbi:hypothetical protein B0A48_11631 [Cryoendolithus antarcticus]|uniref:Heterokaryon incompatibility domain-containing protein n=1 Tax=Cryoendolithus antarcticus TaxID=1507870 RepID=A0A1V8SW48_9PEZI|nr:hypothetical protein B0A48_11631 [Cryoendolithus antarcticus]